MISEGTRTEQRPTNHPDSDHPETWWYACDHPERPFAHALTIFRWTCYSCWLSAFAAVRQGHGGSIRWESRSTGSLKENLLRAGVEYGHFDRAGIDRESL